MEALFGKGHRHADEVALSGGAVRREGDGDIVGPRSRVISNASLAHAGRWARWNSLPAAIALGFDIPLRQSGKIEGTPGGMLMGPEDSSVPVGSSRRATRAHASGRCGITACRQGTA